MAEPEVEAAAAEVRMREAAAAARTATAEAIGRLRRLRAEVERTHRADPSYGAARRSRSRTGSRRPVDGPP